MKTMAIVTINNCPMISAIVSAELCPTGQVERWHVSVVCTETSGAYYATDPTKSFRYLEGTYRETTYPSGASCPLPALIQGRINDTLNQGGYNARCMSPACIRYFRPGLGQINRDNEKVKRIRRLAEEKMRKDAYQVDWYAIAATLGLKVE